MLVNTSAPSTLAASQVQVIKELMRGEVIHATVQMAGVAKDAMLKSMIFTGNAYAERHDCSVKHLHAQWVQSDEI